MKWRGAALVISILVSLSSIGQEKNPDPFLDQVVTTLRNNDTASFVNLFINYYQMKKLMVEAVQRNKDTTHNARVLESIDRYSEKQYDQDVVKGIKKQFSDFRNKIVNKGVNPSGLTFDSSRYEETIPKQFDNQRQFQGTMFVTSGKDVCRIPFTATWLEIQKVWMDIHFVDFLKKGEEHVRRDSSVTVTDTVRVEVVQSEDMEEPPPPPPPPPSPKKKVTTKSPAKKTKVKT